MFTGVNPYSFTLFAETKPTLPQPVIFTVADMQERAMEQAPAREILFINEAEFNCLRDNIFFEARNERSLQAQQAVALVTLKRVASPYYPDSICDVVKQAKMWNGAVIRNRCQFSWYCDGKPDKPYLKNPLEAAAWDRANQVAMDALTGKIEDFLGEGVTHYHADYVKPSWASASRFSQVAKIGRHIFYADTKDKSNWLDNTILASL